MGGARDRTIVLLLVVLSLTLSSAVASGSLPEGDDLTDQAATFGIRAIAEAGLLDPLGQYYGYDGILRFDDHWVIAFRSSTCYQEAQVETCDPNSGTREEHHTDAWLEIAIRDGMFVITDAFGRFTPEQESELRAYSEPATIEQTHLEFPTVRIHPSPDGDGYRIRAAMLWAGPLFVRGVWSVCRPQVYDADGKLLWTGTAIASGTRRGEYFRSNGLLSTGTSGLEGEPARAEMPCELWTKETWVTASQPEINRFPKADAVIVDAPLVWEHEAVVGLESRCRVELRRRDGSPIKAKSVGGPPSPWAGRSRVGELYVRFRLERPRVVASAAIRCMPKGQTF